MSMPLHLTTERRKRKAITRSALLDARIATKPWASSFSFIAYHAFPRARESNENRTPYELMLARFGEGFMEAIGVKRIPGKDVLLKPSLLK